MNPLRLALTGVAALLIVVGASSAQTARLPSLELYGPLLGQIPSHDSEADEKNLAKLESAWAAAVASNDAKRIGGYLANQFLFVGSSGMLQNRAEHLDDFQTGRLKITSVIIQKKVIRVFGNSAVVSFRAVVQGTYSGRDIAGAYQFTDSWIKANNVWQAVARQQTKVAGAAGIAGAAPPAVQDRKLKVNGVELYYKSMGTGAPLVVVHGGPGLDHTYLLPQLGELAANRKVIFYDQRCCGRSGGTPNEHQLTLPVAVEDLEGLRFALGEDRIDVLGYSWGGLPAMAYAIKYPNKVRKLILADSVTATSKEMEDFSPELARRTSKEQQAELTKIRESDDFLLGKGEAMNRFFRLRFDAYFFDKKKLADLTLAFTDDTGKNYNLVGFYFGKTVFEAGYDLTDQLRALATPTLIVHGDADPIKKDYLQRLTKIIANSQFILIRQSGHFTFVEQPAEFNAAVERFLSAK